MKVIDMYFDFYDAQLFMQQQATNTGTHIFGSLHLQSYTNSYVKLHLFLARATYN
jgi:hypothetical protein